HRAANTNKFSLDMQVRVISEMLAGLHYAHELPDFDGRPLNVVHRDVSPHNVFVTFEGQVKLLDFGIAKLSGSNFETATGVIKGKLRYMSPEQIAGEPADRRVDLFAVGVMLWEATAGRKMWHGVTEPVIMNRILNGELPVLSEAKPDVNPELVRIVKKALELEPKDRYQTALELQADLEAYLDQQAASVRLRDLGKVVTELFATDRAETRRIVDEQLAKVTALSAAEYAATSPVELTHIGTHTGLSASATTEAQTVQRGRAWRWIVPAVVVVVALASFAIWRRGAAPAPATDKPLPAATTVTLNVTAFPATARLYLDDQPLTANPFFQTVPRDDREHNIEARAPGYVSEVRNLHFDQNANIVLHLSAAPAPPPNASPVPSAAPASAKTQGGRRPSAKQATPSKPSVDCSVPFTLDSAGVKHFKPECL
ncbi:MAG TPA: serine/threonine-protein kinase, partial [Polyangiaceae bacterium]